MISSLKYDYNVISIIFVIGIIGMMMLVVVAVGGGGGGGGGMA